MSDPRPLVAHVVYRLCVGGLENGLVNLINRLEPEYYRHAVISLTDITDFKERVKRTDVEYISLHKPPGHGIKLYPSMLRLFRDLRPAIVHTRNLAALEATVPACAAGVSVRIHGEHGRDMGDPDGSSRKYQWLRRLYRPFVTRYVAVSRDLSSYLTDKVGVPHTRVAHIYNGVDARRFRPAAEGREPISGCPFTDRRFWIVGHVGRMDAVKDQLTLVRAFIRAIEREPKQRDHLRLVIVGDGALRAVAQDLLDSAQARHLAWLPGERNDIPEILRGLNCFVLPSLGEGISNTILEAMASALPVVATDVGGNKELVEPGRTGELVAPVDPEAMAEKILAYARDPEHARGAGELGRARVERLFSLDAMVARYKKLYDEHLRVSPQHLRPNRSSSHVL